MDDVELERLDHEMDLIADGFPMGKAFWSSTLYEFKQLLKGSFPDLTDAHMQEKVPALFERWARRYEARDKEQERARSDVASLVRARSPQDPMKFLSDGPERTAGGKQLWELANKVGDLYAPRRLQPTPAKWAIDDDSTAA